MPEGEVRGDVKHGEGGKFEDKYSDDEVVQALVEAYPEPLTNKEVASTVGCSKATAHTRLHELNDAGAIHTKEVGARARVWWVDMTNTIPDPIGKTTVERLEDADRQHLIEISSRFHPDFNPTRTDTDTIIDFILIQPWGRVTDAVDDVLRGDTDGDS